MYSSNSAHSDKKSIISRSDAFPRTGPAQTAAIIVKTYVGLGILATPYGMKVSGIILAQAIMLILSFVNIMTVSLTIKARNNSGNKNIRSLP
jgi:amino acid permease